MEENFRFNTGRIFIFGSVGFLLGLSGHSIYPWSKVDLKILFAVLAILGVATCVTWRKKVVGSILVLLLAIMIGVWRFDVSIPGKSQGLSPWLYNYAEIRGQVIMVGGSKVNPTVTVKAQEVSGRKVRGPGQTVISRVSSTSYKVGGDMILACRLKLPTSYSLDFDRKRYLAGKGIWFECQGTASILNYTAPQPYDFLARLADLRDAATARIHSVLPPSEAALLAGILYGDQDFASEQRDLYQRAGLMHLVAVSGSNVTIVVSILLVLFCRLGLHRRQAFWLTSLGLAVFVGFVGFSASVLRAAFMGFLILVARQVGRLATTSRLLLIAAIVLCLFNPWALAFDAGFALSFLATWGILSWTPLFTKRLKFLPNTLGLREIMATTCGATLMTAPYLAWAFDRQSLFGLIANLLALPLIPWTMLWGLLVVVAAKTPVSWFASLPAWGLLKTINLIAGLADHFSWLDLRFQSYSFYFMAATYLCLWQLWSALSRGEENIGSLR